MRKSYFLIGLVAFLLPHLTFSQSLSGIVNHYLKVLEVQIDRVKVADATDLNSFAEGDKVLLIQMTGAQMGGGSRTFPGTLTFIQNCGKFEILQIDEVIKGTDNYVVFTDTVFNAYTNAEKIQLVRIPESEKIVIGGKVTARDWDGNTGGIVAVIGLDTIDLQADIDVSGQGFRGAQPEDISPDVCNAAKDTVNLMASETGHAGHKGEGIIAVGYLYTMSSAHALNGGGGGNGKYAGGGGGSNYRGGGRGGVQYNACTPTAVVDRADGGFNQLDFSNRFYLGSTRQIIMGGGGGSGTQNTSLGRTGTKGGDGGGIIILITETLVGSGGTLYANGENVTETASAGGGGGGGGGTILVDAAAYAGAIPAEVKGGNGGNTFENCTGAGGSGSGGLFWYPGNALYSGFSVSYSAGINGEANAGCDISARQFGFTGSAGATEDSLLLILNGFLFNTVRSKDTICAGQTPRKLTGSNPKGGNGKYTYEWQESIDNITFGPAAGTDTLRDYTPPVLTQTTYYRRKVKSEGIEDMSKSIEVYVYNAIDGNAITGTDTLCNAATAKQISGSVQPALSGGNGVFNYKWLSSLNGSSWDTLSGATGPNYDPGPLYATHFYRRHVTSTKYCRNTSGSVTLTVLPSLDSNSFFSPDTTICQAFSPGLLNARQPTGGDDNYRYAWMKKPASGNWQEIGSSNVLQFDPGTLDETTLYRRIVYSGNDNACMDTSSIKQVIVLPSITNNLIGTDSGRYCAGDRPNLINGLIPAGGSGNYAYQWQIKTSGDWISISGETGKDITPAMVETDSSGFRRLVTSGQYGACKDTSTPLLLRVVPYIVNHLGINDSSMCQNNIPLPFNSGMATGGFGNFTYQWRVKEDGSASWNNAPGASTSPAYSSGMLERTTLFTREVRSDICEHISDTIAITVYSLISNNSINGDLIQYTCYNSPMPLNGSTPQNGNPGDYAYLWQQSSNGFSWENATGNTSGTQLNFESSPLTDSILYRRIVNSSSLLKECSDTSDPVTIRINSLPSGDVISSIDTVCAGETLYVSFNASGGHEPWDVTLSDGANTWSKSGVNASSDSIPMAFENVQGVREIRITEIRDDNGCLADLQDNRNYVVAQVYAVPIAEAGQGGEVCSDRFALSATEPLASHTGLWTVEDGSFTDPNNPVTLVTMDNFEGSRLDANLVWTVTNWHCFDTDTAVVIFDKQPTDIDPGEDMALDFIYTTQLNAKKPLVGTGKWQVVEGTGIIDNDTLYNATITELADKNLIRWTISNGVCPEIKDSVEITVNDLDIPEGFSPNNDGINEAFVIPTSNAEKIEIKIYNRTGVLVWESSDYTRGELWGGTAIKTDNMLPEGTYFYWMRIKVMGKTESKEYKKFVEIRR